MTTITTEDARALVALVDYIESRFPHVDMPSALLQTIPGRAVTGEPFVELMDMKWYKTRDEVLAAARATFDAYATGKTGTLYWRCKPEIDEQVEFRQGKGGWRFYMRLLISDKGGAP